MKLQLLILLCIFSIRPVSCQWYKVANINHGCQADIAFADSLHGFIVATSMVDSPGTVMHTDDGGNSWTNDTTFAGRFNNVTFVTPDTGYICCNPSIGGEILYTYDKGMTWTPNESDAVVSFELVSFTDVAEAVGIYMLGTAINSTRLIENFELYGFDQVISFGNIPWDIEFPDPDTGYLCGEIYSDYVTLWGYGTYKTVDGAESWYTTENMYGPIFYISFPSTQVGYGVGFEHKLWKTDDYGESWYLLEFDFGEDLGNLFFSSDSVGYLTNANTNYKILRTTNGGLSWIGTEFTSAPSYGIEKVYCVNDTVCFALTCDEIYKTTNGGGIGVPIASNISKIVNIPFFLSPNPACRTIKINYNIKAEIYHIITTNYLGEKINITFNTSPADSGESMLADISHLPPGIYFTEIITEQGKGVQKWVKL